MLAFFYKLFVYGGMFMKTIKDKYSDLPSWYHKSPVVITYPIVGKKDSDLEMKPGGLYPYTNGLPVIDYYSRKSSKPY